MGSGDDGVPLKKATAKAAKEVTNAAVDVEHGCEVPEALHNRVGTGVEDAVGEYSEMTRKTGGDGTKLDQAARNQDQANPGLWYQISSGGLILMPYNRELIPEVSIGTKENQAKEGREVFERQRSDQTRRIKHLGVYTSSVLIPSIGYPQVSFRPMVQLAITPDALHAAVQSIFVIGHIFWMKKFKPK